MSSDPQRTFVIVIRGPSAAIFWPGESFHVTLRGSPHGPIELDFRSRYKEIVKGCPQVPTDLWLEIRGTGPDLKSAMSRLSPEYGGMLAAMSFLANARIGPLGLEIAFEATEGAKSRDFFQRFYPEQKIRSICSRRLVPTDIAVLCDKLQQHPALLEISSTMGRYADALDHWGQGSEALAVWFTYVGVETITTAHMNWYMTKHGLTEGALIAKLVPEKTPECDVKNVLRNAYRREIIFQADAESFKKARSARNELSHSVKDVFALRERAGDAQHRALSYLRDAIFDVLEVPDAFRATYTTEPYNQPRGELSVDKYLWATLTSESGQWARDGQEYAMFEWTSKITKVEVSDEGRISVTPTDTITPRCGKDCKASNISIEYWDASLAPNRNVPVADGPVSVPSAV